MEKGKIEGKRFVQRSANIQYYAYELGNILLGESYLNNYKEVNYTW